MSVLSGCRWRVLRSACRLALGGLLIAGSACTSVTAVETQPDIQTFEQYFELAQEALAAGDRGGAKTLFELAVQRNPGHPYPHFYLGVIYSETGKDDLALVAFEQALKLEPNLHEAYHNIGTIMLRRRDLAAAVEALELAVELDPDHVPSYNNLGKAYYMAGLPALAGAAYEEALARDPDNLVALENLVLLARAAGADEAQQQYLSRLRGEQPSDDMERERQ